jgi:predicted GTPase
VINKIDSATPEGLALVRANLAAVNPAAVVVEARSSLALEGGDITGKRVVVIEDGPTLTHGGMTFGAGVVAAQRFGAAAIVDPRPYAVGSLKATLEKYPALVQLLPAMGYGDAQVADLEATLNAMPADVVLSATPIDITRVLTPTLPVVRVRYELEETAGTQLETALAPIVAAARSTVPAG